MIGKEKYLNNPCGASSLPYYKEKNIKIPDNILIINDKDYKTHKGREYIDEKYFRLLHNLQDVREPILSAGFSLTDISDEELSLHINSCYENISISADDIKRIKASEVYDEELIVAVKNNESDEIAASGIAVLDREINEGVLEWIQVSGSYRRRGLGEFIVQYLLNKLKSKADFVTVSGKVHNRNKPEALYRKCGFKGNDIWHILMKKF